MNESHPTSLDWLKRMSADDHSLVTMICFPPAGGGMMGFWPWIAPLRGRANVYAAALPGRDQRLREEPARALEALASPLAEAVAALADKPLLVFGHSFGALVAYEMIHRLFAEGSVAPERVHFLASGRVAPHLPSRAPRVSHLAPRDVVFRVAELHGNIPVALLEQPEFVAMIGRALQADLHINETYAWTERAPLPCPMTAIGGDADPVVSEAELDAWERHAGGGFERRLVAGDHFYFRPAAGQQTLMEIVSACCASLAATTQ
ncbi:thioesterase [Methylosinus sp. H3A]|uniref:thioesterase II family protein n=1 Tax=Methylosinus sp. H3A TaxID=2785786 RepID=UPI0018C2A81A|nr:alpha/beta fold hydrolase [Methylosinus sp. H3A]MBG0810439.1 thioesterase [Methylosinus sp. H3A]